MIDLNKLESYRENNRIEAKKALGGFPQSVWETYSAFANTLGGIILLGVEERKDHSLHAVNLPAPEKLVKELYDTLNNPAKVSVNVLTGNNVKIEEVDGKRIIVITVPRAHRYDRPVFVGGNAQSGTYRRCGEGDYKCPQEEIEAMLRDAAKKTADMRLLKNLGLSALSYTSLHEYRKRMEICRSEHAWHALNDDGFLFKLGATAKGNDGALHPTAAGLLMFGSQKEIVKIFANYRLSYRDLSDEICSDSGDWSGNICDFYLFVRKKAVQEICVPLSAGAGKNIDLLPVYKAVREALANCLVNADYYGQGGIVIVKGHDFITFSNPGGFRIDVKKARAGGISDPRNGALVKMFNLIDAGDGTGSGLPHIYAVWERHGWLTPRILESFNPERTTFSLTIGRREKTAQKPKAGLKALAQKAEIIEYLTDHASGTTGELCRLLGIKSAQLEKLLCDLIAADVIARNKGNDTFTLKR